MYVCAYEDTDYHDMCVYVTTSKTCHTTFSNKLLIYIFTEHDVNHIIRSILYPSIGGLLMLNP